MTLFTVVQLLARTALVDTDHGHTDGPRRFTDTETEISVIGVDIAPLLEGLDDFNDRFQEVVVELALFEFAEELVYVSPVKSS